MAGRVRVIFAGGKVNWDEHALRILLSGPTGETSQEIQRRANAVRLRAQRAAPVRTGALRSSIHMNTTHPTEGASADIYSDSPYSLYVEFGRSAVDLRGTRKYLHWQEGLGGAVFTQHAAAVRATHFMESALDAAGDG